MNPAITDNIMVDIETVGRRPNGLIVSIGAIFFSTRREDYEAGRIFTGKPEHEFHAVLSLDALATEKRLVTEQATLAWWKEQGDAWTRLETLMRASQHDLESLMSAFSAWLKPFCAQGCNVIGNSPSFDLVMIENACKVTGVEYPVGHRDESDYRMLTDIMWGPANKPRPRAADAHDALFDAKFQAQVYTSTLLTIQMWRRIAEATGNIALAV
jgi:DNA polymerase III epsilon subunit-like protein